MVPSAQVNAPAIRCGRGSPMGIKPQNAESPRVAKEPRPGVRDPHPLIAPLKRLAIPTLLVLLTCQEASAQSLTLVERETRQRGNFAVGFGTSTDNGNYALDVLTLDPGFSNVASDSGAAAAATAAFTTAQAYAISVDRVDFSGSALTSIDAPPNVVSFADALSQLALVLVLTQATPFELRVDVVEILGATVNNLGPRADAQFRLTGPGDSWLYNTSGSFLQTGVLAAGTWRIDAFASARGNGEAGFGGTLLLAPVPEPSAWLLMVLGLAAMGLRRVSADATPATQAWSTPARARHFERSPHSRHLA